MCIRDRPVDDELVVFPGGQTQLFQGTAQKFRSVRSGDAEALGKIVRRVADAFPEEGTVLPALCVIEGPVRSLPG